MTVLFTLSSNKQRVCTPTSTGFTLTPGRHQPWRLGVHDGDDSYHDVTFEKDTNPEMSHGTICFIVLQTILQNITELICDEIWRRDQTVEGGLGIFANYMFVIKVMQ